MPKSVYMISAEMFRHFKLWNLLPTRLVDREQNTWPMRSKSIKCVERLSSPSSWSSSVCSGITFSRSEWPQVCWRRISRLGLCVSSEPSEWNVFEIPHDLRHCVQSLHHIVIFGHKMDREEMSRWLKVWSSTKWVEIRRANIWCTPFTLFSFAGFNGENVPMVICDNTVL